MVVIADAAPQLLGPRVGEWTATPAARRSLREQIARLERDLAETLVSAFPAATLTVEDARIRARGRGPRLLDIGELEVLRDDLAARLKLARARQSSRTEAQIQARELLEEMFLDPRKHKFRRIRGADLGERTVCEWRVVPRWGPIGMFAGWWHVKLSSGCPLASR